MNTPQIEKIANKVTPVDMAYRYKRAYELELKKENESMQKRILSKPEKDKEVDAFIQRVAVLAEGPTEL
jgi:hypothetical protein